MAKPPQPPAQAPALDDLRKEIDQIDEAMHQLLMERGEIIDRLISVKRSQETGSAFRPAREAEMMRRLVKRHKGILPLDTAESIWRVIISTFTYVQSPFSVHADLSAGDALMRDSARFHFGFTVPFVAHMGASAVVAAVSTSKGDLGLVPAFAVPAAGAWWSALEFDAAPKIIGRLAGFRALAGRRRRHGDGRAGVERARVRLGRGRRAGAVGAGRFHRRARPRLRRRRPADHAAEGSDPGNDQRGLG
jgi:chorismate mutase